jgi:hypothetical protein
MSNVKAQTAFRGETPVESSRWSTLCAQRSLSFDCFVIEMIRNHIEEDRIHLILPRHGSSNPHRIGIFGIRSRFADSWDREPISNMACGAAY